MVRALRQRLPRESILYLGDTARVPYGSKSPEVVTRYALNCAGFLVEQGAKALVIACNTASAVAVPALEARFQVPVLGVIEPGAQLAARRTKGRVGVIGTEGTIRSGRYQALIRELAPQAGIVVRPCPMFVPLAEEGMADHPAARLIAQDYLQPLLEEGIDTLVLGCTHYPVLEALIRDVCGPKVEVINSALAVAEAFARELAQHRIEAAHEAAHEPAHQAAHEPAHQTAHAPTHRFFATDAGERFERVGRIFLGDTIRSVEWVDVG